MVSSLLHIFPETELKGRGDVTIGVEKEDEEKWKEELLSVRTGKEGIL
jgi:hypothetical protein